DRNDKEGTAETAKTAETLISACSAVFAVSSDRVLPLRAGLAGRPHFRLRQREGNVLTRVVAAADRDDEVLAAVGHVGHRRAALRRRHPYRADFLAVGLVVGAEHRAA